MNQILGLDYFVKEISVWQINIKTCDTNCEKNLRFFPIHFHKICWQNCLSKTKFIYTSTNCTYSLWRAKFKCSSSWHHLILCFHSDQMHHKNIFNELSVFWNPFFLFALTVLSIIRHKEGKKSQVHLSIKYSKVSSEAAVGMDYRVKKATSVWYLIFVSNIMHKLTQVNT